jgi:hypothetical protein
MPITHGFEVRAFDCNIQLAADCLDTCVVLERYVFPSLPRLSGTFAKPDIFIRIDRVVDQFQLSVDDVVVSSAVAAIILVPDLIRALDDAVIQRLTSLRAVHAGVVFWGDRTLLLPGISHAGKSSLVAELLRRGATYFSDEYALIDSEGRVHPYPRPLLLRNGSPEQFPVLPAEYNAPTGDTPAPVGWILTLEYLPESTWSLSTISQSEALLILLRNTPQILSESPDMVAVFQRAVAGAICLTGTRPDADEAVNQILQLIGSPHLTQPVSQNKACRS